ncbi:uncharacterized protein [Elaeis guineensis]|uniref:uncharacterized protein n=1 Tax=Elaeis guineensis var. tenera TaxID=51953 RepID=UPI003C6D67A2
MKIALKAKDKLGFINGKCVMHDVETPLFEKWQRVDSMVLSWILNSISKDLVEAFLYVTTVCELWNELEQRFGESNGPLLYQIRPEISSFSQENISVMVYFTKLKKLWDELSCLMNFSICTCGAAKTVASIENEDRLIQFLMGLNDSYDHVRNQILLLDPLPTVNKAYSMVLRVEKQCEVLSTSDSMDHARAMKVKGLNAEGTKEANIQKSQNSSSNKKRDFARKEDRFCTYCKVQGHIRDTCFKLHGYPDWYKELKQKCANQQNQAYTARVHETPMDDDPLNPPS